jgi:hypothetical protein
MLLKVCRLKGIICGNIGSNQTHKYLGVNTEMGKRAVHGIELRIILAENILAYRRQKNLSQEKLAEICEVNP